MTLLSSLLSRRGYAEGRYMNITVNGSYDQEHTKDYDYTKRSYGLEVAFPITWFFEIAVGTTANTETKKYTDAGTVNLIDTHQISFMTGNYFQTITQTDVTINGSLGYPVGYIYPYLFGGYLKRSYDENNSVYDTGTIPLNTYDAGIGVSIFVTNQIRLKLSERFSPSTRKSTQKLYDSLLSVGLTWGI